MTDKTERPEFVLDEYLEYLDNLRESSVTNMFGARPYLQDNFPELNRKESGDVLSYWMKSFGSADR